MTPAKEVESEITGVTDAGLVDMLSEIIAHDESNGKYPEGGAVMRFFRRFDFVPESLYSEYVMREMARRCPSTTNG